jgi:hypothetical protein
LPLLPSDDEIYQQPFFSIQKQSDTRKEGKLTESKSSLSASDFAPLLSAVVQLGRMGLSHNHMLLI